MPHLPSDFLSRLLRLPADTLVCLVFFTRLPITPRPDAAFDMRASSAAWPLVGAILGGVAALVLWIAVSAGLSPMVAAILAVATLVALTGALHEDGLADTADGLGGGKTAEAKRAIMRDSRLGTFGALALLLCILGRIAALAALTAFPGRAAVALIAAAALSRSLALWHWRTLPPAWSDGLARLAGQPDRQAAWIAATLGFLATVAALAAFATAALLAFALAALGVWLLTHHCRKSIGGHSGDTIGASQQIAETLLLAGFSAGVAPIVI